VQIGWSFSLHCQKMMFEVGRRSQGGIIQKTVTHSPCTVCAWHLKTISFSKPCTLILITIHFNLKPSFIHCLFLIVLAVLAL